MLATLPRSSGGEDERKVPIVSASDTPFETQCVLASCQSLALLDGEVVGDPLEKACLSAINWTINKGLSVSCMLCGTHNLNREITNSSP